MGAAAASATAQQAPAPANDATLGGLDAAGPGVGVGGPFRDEASMETARSLEGVGVVLDETWDTAESPNFAAALQASEHS